MELNCESVSDRACNLPEIIIMPHAKSGDQNVTRPTAVKCEIKHKVKKIMFSTTRVSLCLLPQ